MDSGTRKVFGGHLMMNDLHDAGEAGMRQSPSGEPDAEFESVVDQEYSSDAIFLQQFLECHDERAFAALMERHGPMVLATCRRQLGNSSDADDAYQATFLVLARKGASIRKLTHLGPWLYRVACLTSGKLRRSAQRNRQRDQRFGIQPEQALSRVDAVADDDELALLDQALAELPSKYRIPLVLCELQGLSRRQAARHLRISEGTLSSRLARGRVLLRRRLAAYFGALTIAMLIALLLRARAPVVVPPKLAAGALKAASDAAGLAAICGAVDSMPQALADGVIKTMLLSKLKLLAIASVSICLLGGAGVLIHANAGPAQQAQNDPIPVEGVWVAVGEGGAVFHGQAAVQGEPVKVVEGFFMAVGEGVKIQGQIVPQVGREEELFVEVSPAGKPEKR